MGGCISSCGARLFVVADFVSLAAAFKKATGSLTPSLLLSAKSHAALRPLAYKCARHGCTCYQLFADTWLCADAHCGSPTAAPTIFTSCGAQNRRARLSPLPGLTAAPTNPRCIAHRARSDVLPFIRHWQRSKMLPLAVPVLDVRFQISELPAGSGYAVLVLYSLWAA